MKASIERSFISFHICCFVMRYEKIVQCEKIGQEGHRRVRAAVVAIVGVGALGSVAAEMLVRSGVRKVVLIDRDVVE